MVLTKRLSVVLMVLPLMIAASAGQTHGATIRAAGVAYEDVRVAVAAAASGDTVVVPAGSATWLSTLKITKRIWLVGAGVGQTIITSGVASRDCIISYAPSDAASTSFFRLSGFTLDSNNTSRLVEIVRTSTLAATYVRIDHNRFVGALTSFPAVLMIQGMVYGVVDNNTFDNQAHIDNYGLSATAWKNLTYRPGTADNLYYEDNTFNLTQTADSGGHGGRYAKRYNDYNLQDPRPYTGLSGFYPLFDAHGNQLGDIHAAMGVEVYANKVSGNFTMNFLVQRGGKGVVLFNKLLDANSVGIVVADEVADSACVPSTAADGTPQRPNSSYYWNNRSGADGSKLFHALEGKDVEGKIAENVSWWNHNDSFDGRAGIGCGTLAARPATCSPGVAYWVSEQSCSYIDDRSVGRNPAIPISGTLHRCSAAGTWEEYFTPFTYPHPFRGPAPPGEPKMIR